MYSLVLATVLAAGGDATGWCHGCRGCHGCWGCYGCYGCSCSGCWGCYGGYGCHGCWGGYCSGCWGCSCSGGYYSSCWGCYGCSCSCMGVVYGCSCSCIGAVTVAPAAVTPAPAPAPKATTSSGLTPEEVDVLRRFLRNMANKEEKKSTQTTPAAEAPVATDVARITVRLPADARLFIDHVECPLTSPVRAFNTPKLEPNQAYTYTLRAELTRDGETVRERQAVLVSAGRQVEVDFTRLGAAATTAQR